MVVCILIPFILSITYSYSMDYRPQGRYLMPALIPLCYYCIRGLDFGLCLIQNIASAVNKEKPVSNRITHLLTGLSIVVMTLIVVALIVTVYGYAYPYYVTL